MAVKRTTRRRRTKVLDEKPIPVKGGFQADVRWHGLFLDAYRLKGQVLHALDLIGVAERTFYVHLEKYPKFREAYERAKEADTQEIELTARQRAVDGVLRKKFGRDGKPLIDPETGRQYEEREYSDTLAIFLLKARRPGMYRDGFMPNGGPTGDEPDAVKRYDSDLAKHWKQNATPAKK